MVAVVVVQVQVENFNYKKNHPLTYRVVESKEINRYRTIITQLLMLKRVDNKMNTLNTYKFEEIPDKYQSDALENVSIYMYEKYEQGLFNNSDIMESEIDELIFNYDVTFTQILEESKKLTFTYWGDIL